MFFGREKEVRSIIEQINTPGQHSLLYGERGVGKSSLATIASELLLSKLISGKLHYERCDSTTTFASLLRDPLAEVGIDLSIVESARLTKADGKLGINVGAFKAGMGGASEDSQKLEGPSAQFSPSFAAKALASSNGLLVIDEADVLQSGDDKRSLAEFIKQLSDRNAKFKVLVVGVAETGEELTAGHPSVNRCLRETKLRRMPARELAQIVTGGADKLDLLFEGDAVDSIVRVSAGYPHFTHLLALKCAENAIADDRKRISIHHLREALKEATDDAEGTLSRTYQDAIRSYNTDMYKMVVCAAANLQPEEFAASELRKEIESISGESISQNSLNNYFKRLVSDDEATILRRTGKGVYRFADPRMASFVKIANSMV